MRSRPGCRRSALESVLADFDPAEHAGKSVGAGADLSGGAGSDRGRVRGRDRDREGADGTTSSCELPTYDAWVEAWTPQDTLAERSLRDETPYDVWVQEGYLNAIPGKNIRLDFVAARVAEANSEYQIKLLAYDRYAYRRFADSLDELGVTINQAEHPQGGVRRAKATEEQIEEAKSNGEDPPLGLWMPGSVLELETLILEKRIRIRRSPVIVSAIMGAAVEHDPFDNRWFSKRKATVRIDPLVALTMAVGAATAAPAGTGESAYETQTLRVI